MKLFKYSAHFPTWNIIPDIRIQFKQQSIILLKTPNNTQPWKSMSSVCQTSLCSSKRWDCGLGSKSTDLILILNTSKIGLNNTASNSCYCEKIRCHKFKWLHCWLLIKDWALNSDCTFQSRKTPVISTRYAQHKWDENQVIQLQIRNRHNQFFGVSFQNLSLASMSVVCQAAGQMIAPAQLERHQFPFWTHYK